MNREQKDRLKRVCLKQADLKAAVPVKASCRHQFKVLSVGQVLENMGKEGPVKRLRWKPLLELVKCTRCQGHQWRIP